MCNVGLIALFFVLGLGQSSYLAMASSARPGARHQPPPFSAIETHWRGVFEVWFPRYADTRFTGDLRVPRRSVSQFLQSCIDLATDLQLSQKELAKLRVGSSAHLARLDAQINALQLKIYQLEGQLYPPSQSVLRPEEDQEGSSPQYL